MDIGLWIEIAKYGGAGGCIILGIVAWQLWHVYRLEVQYSKERDKETMTVLSEMLRVQGERSQDSEHKNAQILASLEELKRMISQHLHQK